MKTFKATLTEAKIFDAIKAAKAKGLKIVDGGWYVKWDADAAKFVPETNCCCPLGAVLLASNDMPLNVCDLADGENDHDALARAAAGFLNKPTGWCDTFVETFDSPEWADTEDTSARAALKVREVIFDEDHSITK